MDYIIDFCRFFSDKRDIDDVLIGDKEVRFGELSLHMPKLSGFNIYHDLRNMFHLPLDGEIIKESRWQYMGDFIYDGFCNKTINSILTYLFSMGRVSNSYDDLIGKSLIDVSGLSIVYFIRDINNILSSFDSFLPYKYRIVERNKKFYINSSEEDYFDSYLNHYDRLYRKYSLSELSKIFNNSGKKDNYNGHHENFTNIYAGTINSKNFDTNVNNYNYYFDPRTLNNKIQYNIYELEKGLSDTQYKDYPTKSNSYMKNEKHGKALKLLRKIPQNILETKNVLSAAKYLIKFCGLFL